MNKSEYHRIYYLKNKDKILKRDFEYRLKNKDRVLKQKADYYIKNKKELLKRQAEYRLKNKDRVKELRIKYRETNNIKTKEFIHRNLLSWLDYIPKETTCQICKKTIYFGQNNRRNAIHFDHRSEGIEKIKSPTHWLGMHKNTLENRKIWEECSFGMLCKNCNSFLPTNNRKEYIQKVINYIKLNY